MGSTLGHPSKFRTPRGLLYNGICPAALGVIFVPGIQKANDETGRAPSSEIVPFREIVDSNCRFTGIG